MSITVHFMPSAGIGNYIFNDEAGTAASILAIRYIFHGDVDAIKTFYAENPESKLSVATFAPGSMGTEQRFAMATISQEGWDNNDMFLCWVCPSAEEVYELYLNSDGTDQEITISGDGNLLLNEVERMIELLTIPLGKEPQLSIGLSDIADPSDPTMEEKMLVLTVKDSLKSVREYMALSAAEPIDTSIEESITREITPEG